MTLDAVVIFNFLTYYNLIKMPLVNPSSFSGCAPRTAFLSDYFGKNVPVGRDNGQLGFLQFLVSQANLAGVRRLSDDIVGVPGKKRGVKLQFDTPLCVDVCTADYVCTDTKGEIKPAIQFAEFDIETKYHVCDAQGVPAALKFTDSEFAQYCQLDDEAFLQNQFAQFDMSMFKAIDKALVELLRTLVPAANDKTFPFFKVNSTTGYKQLNDEWLLWMSESLVDAGIDIADVVIMGGRMVKAIQAKYQLASASSEGFDLSKNSGSVPPLYYDRNFDSVFGANALVLVPRAALQLVTFNEYVGAKAFRGETAINATKVMPLGNGSSIEFDYQWRKDVDCPGYSYFPSLYAELIKAIPGGCAGNSDGILVFKDCEALESPVC